MMTKRFRFVHRFLFILSFAGLMVSAFAQAQPVPKSFEPSVGQPGKDVVWVPTSHALVDKMLDLAKVTADDYLIDLGSGDGRTVIAAAKRGAKALGIEYNPDMVELSKANAEKEGVATKAQFAKADLFETDFSAATVITMFLLPDINVRLRPKILDLKPGTRIVSNTFTMGDWTADETSGTAEDSSNEQEAYSSYRTALLWIVPAKVAGTWQMPQGELVLTQTYQVIEGTLKNGGKSIAISNGKLRGDQIHFNAGDSEYSGTVSSNRIRGTMKTGTGSAAWTATLSPAQN